jgi:hypothetical protein
MRSERFGLILSEREKEALARLAEADGGLSAAALVRRLVRQEARRRGLWPATTGQPTPAQGGER